MDILTLELGDVTVSQALLRVKAALDRHPGHPLRILVGSDEMVKLNVERLLLRLGRGVASHPEGRGWRLEVRAGSIPTPSPEAPPEPSALPAPSTPPPALLLRSALTPGDRTLGRTLLLGLLEHLPPGTPWLGLAHGALELLDDPTALEHLNRLQERGTVVRICETSRAYLGYDRLGFAPMAASEWQALLARGSVTLL